MKFSTYKYLIVILICSSIVSCDLFNKKNKQEDVSIEVIGLDLLPMYGSPSEYGGYQKTAEQIESDRIFLAESDKAQPSRIIACKDYIEFGWYYLRQGDTDMAMRRANQAWQLDSTNPETYGLFSAILNAREDHIGAIDMLSRGINIQPDHILLYDMYLSESIDTFRQTSDDTEIRNLIEMLNNLTITEDSAKIKIDAIREEALEHLKLIKNYNNIPQ